MSTSCLSVLQIISQHAPREWRTNRSNPRSTYTMKCPLCEHEPRGGNQPNYFTVTVDEQKWKCHVHDGGGNARQLLRLLTQGHDITAPDLPPDSSRTSTKDGERISWQGATISQLAQAKGFAPSVLVPAHCTGFSAKVALSRALPDEFIPNSVGTRITM